MPIYSAMVFKMPIFVCNKIDQIYYRFLWAKSKKCEELLSSSLEICLFKQKARRSRAMKNEACEFSIKG